MIEQDLGELSGDYRVWPRTRALVIVSPNALVPEDTLIWHFARILGFTKIGKDVSIGSCSEIGKTCTIGDRCRISAHVFIPNRTQIGADCFIGPGAIFTDDRYPRVLKEGESYMAEPSIIEDNVGIGAGAVILPGVRIGRGAMIGAGSVISGDVAPGTIMYGPKAQWRATRPLSSPSSPLDQP